MRRLWCFILMGELMLGLTSIFGGARSLAAQIVHVTEPSQVITRDDLRSLGVARLSDVVSFIDNARALSLDGFGMRVSLGGLGTFHESAPAIFVDGHPVDLGLLAAGDLNLIGLPVDVIDRVEIYARPTLIAGVFAGRGAIHISTKQSDYGTEFYGRVLAGVDASEEGLNSYSDGRRTAGDLSGPDLEAAVLADIASGSALSAVVHRRHAHAHRAETGMRPLSVVTAPAITFTGTDERVHFSAVGLGVTSSRFPYLPFTSQVLSTDYRGAAVSAMGAHRLSDRSFLRHRATMNVGRSRHHIDPGTWNERAFMWTSALTRTLDERVVVLGGTIELRTVHVGDAAGNMRWGSVFAAISGHVGPGIHYRGGGMVAMDGRSVAVKAYGGLTLERWEHHRAEVNIAVVDGLLHEQNAADFWAREKLPPPNFPEEAVRPFEDVTIRATFDADWRWQIDTAQELHVGAGLRRSPKIYLPAQNVLPVTGGGLQESIAFEYTSGTQGILFGVFTTHVLPGRQRLFLNWQQTVSGERTYNEVWDAVPDARAGISLSTPMISGFRMHASVARESGRTWREFETVPGIRSNLHANTMVDVYVTRRLLAGRLFASIGVWNALGEKIIHHPLGDTFGRSVRVDLRLDLARRRP